jgi:hypothetical protein
VCIYTVGHILGEEEKKTTYMRRLSPKIAVQVQIFSHINPIIKSTLGGFFMYITSCQSNIIKKPEVILIK